MAADRPRGDRVPILNVPAAVKAVLAITVAVHLIRLVLPADLDWAVVRHLGLVPARDASFALASLLPLVGHMTLHADLAHLAINMLFLLALGSGVAQQVGTARFIVLYVLTGMAGGIAFMAIDPRAVAILIGASGAVSGLMGGLVHLIFRRPGQAPGNGRRALAFIAVWMGVNWLIGVQGGEVIGASGPIAWQAHMGGFLAGLALYPMLRYSPRGGAGPPFKT